MSPHRTLEVIRKRALTFLTVYAVVMVAATILVVGLKSSETPCVDTAHEVWLPLYLEPKVETNVLFDRILAALSRQSYNVRLRLQNESTHSGTYVDLDTTAWSLHANSLRVWEQHSSFYDDTTIYRVRYLSSTLCRGPPTTFIDLNHNVDKDAVSFKRVATVINGSTTFIYESQLRTSLIPQIERLQQLINIVPYLQSIHVSGSQAVLRSRQMRYRTMASSPVLSSRGATTIQLVIDRWSGDADLAYWKITLKTQNPKEEAQSQALYRLLTDALAPWAVKDSTLGAVAEF